MNQSGIVFLGQKYSGSALQILKMAGYFPATCILNRNFLSPKFTPDFIGDSRRNPFHRQFKDDVKNIGESYRSTEEGRFYKET